MFEDELEDDFLTSWKPTKMDIDVDLDRHKVPGPKSAVKTKFASSKMEMDFDFDGGFSKLSSFDIDLSFESPPSPAKKAKKRPKQVAVDNNLEFDLKGFETENLEDIKVTENGKLSESERDRAGAATVIDHNQLKSVRKGQREDTRDVSPYMKEDPKPAIPDARGSSTSSSLQPDPVFAHHALQDTAGVVHHEKNVHIDFELTPSALGSNGPPVCPFASKKKAANTDTFQSRSGLESDSLKCLNPVLESVTVPVEEISSSRPEGSEPTPANARPKFSDQDHLAQDLGRQHVKQQTSDPEMALTRSSTILNDQKDGCASLDFRRCSTLQFDPLSKSSQNSVVAVPQSESFRHADSRHESKCFKLADEARAQTVENQHRGTAVLESDELSLAASGPPMPVATRSTRDHGGGHGSNIDTVQRSELQNVTEMPVKLSPAIASLSLNDTQKEDEEEAYPSTFNKSSPVVPCVTLEERGRDSISTQAPAVSIKKSQILRGDGQGAHFEGKQRMAREDPTRGQLKLKTAPKSGNSGMMVLKHKNTIPNQKEHSLGASKRPSRELQLGLQRTSPLQLGKGQGDSCGTHIHAERERQQIVRHNVVGVPTAVTPVDGIKQGLEVQKSITNKVKAQNMPTSRTLATSKFFATDTPTSIEKEIGHQMQTPQPDLGKSSKLMSSACQMRTLATDAPTSTQNDIGHQIHTPRPDLGKSSKLISSTTCQMRTHTQPNVLVGGKHAVRKISGTSEVSRGKGFQTNSSSRDIEIRASGNSTETTARPQAHGIGRTTLQSSLSLKPQVDGHKVQADRRSRQKRPSLERVEDSVPFSEKVQNQKLPVSTETPMGHLPAQGSADLLITEDNHIEELYFQYTDKLDAMLKVLRKLNDDAKNLLVRAHVTNNKLRMLDSPMVEFKLEGDYADPEDPWNKNCRTSDQEERIRAKYSETRNRSGIDKTLLDAHPSTSGENSQ